MTESAPSRPLTGLFRDVVVDAIEAIGDELSAQAATDTSAIDLRNGRHVGSVGTHHLWSFEVDSSPPVPPETPGRLVLAGRGAVRATILAAGDLDVVLGVDDELGDALPRATLSVQPWFILDALRDRLGQALDEGGDVALTEALLDLDEPAPVAGRAAVAPLSSTPLLSDEQLAAAAHAARRGLQFVWGPPGTGKTSTLAATTALLAGPALPSSGPGVDPPKAKVLVVAHANAAVDVAMARIADALAPTGLVDAGRVLRVGTPHLPIVRDRPEILPDEIVARDHPGLIRRRDQLEAERRTISNRLNASAHETEQAALVARLDEVRAALAEIASRLRDARVALILDARVIGATLSKLVLDDLLWRWPSSAVIIDEASMSGLPFVLAVALRGTPTLTCFGDFRQLPPIAVSGRESTRLWFGRDVFELSGVISRFEADEPDPRLAILRTQYRMGTTIGRVVGRFAYFDLLRTDAGAAATAERLAQLPPREGAEIVIVDTTRLGSVCLQEADPASFSRLNLLSASLTASLVHLVTQKGATAGAVTPYRAQARLLEAMLGGHPGATAATTHRFQGSERDAIVVDLTDAEPEDGPSRLTGRDPDLSLRLFNVAISRAKGKLLLVADLSFLTTRHPSTSPARQLLELAASQGAVTVAAEGLLERFNAPAISWTRSWVDAVTELLGCVPGEPADIDVSVATEDQAGAWLAHVATELPALGHSVTVRAPLPVALPLELTPVELKLRVLGPGPVAFAGEAAIAVGSSDPAGPAVCITDKAVVVAARRRLLAE